MPIYSSTPQCVSATEVQNDLIADFLCCQRSMPVNHPPGFGSMSDMSIRLAQSTDKLAVSNAAHGLLNQFGKPFPMLW